MAHDDCFRFRWNRRPKSRRENRAERIKVTDAGLSGDRIPANTDTMPNPIAAYPK